MMELHKNVFINELGMIMNSNIGCDSCMKMFLTCSVGVCTILPQLYTSTERLKRVYTSPGPLLEIDYFK
jgi:hypothetical protein